MLVLGPPRVGFVVGPDVEGKVLHATDSAGLREFTRNQPLFTARTHGPLSSLTSASSRAASADGTPNGA